MIYLQGIFFFDVSVIIFMMVLSYLSSRLGEALKIPAYYKIFYVTSFIIICASALDIVSGVVPLTGITTISLFMRFVAGVLACAIGMRYWMWVFTEFFKR